MPLSGIVVVVALLAGTGPPLPVAITIRARGDLGGVTEPSASLASVTASFLILPAVTAFFLILPVVTELRLQLRWRRS